MPEIPQHYTDFVRNVAVQMVSPNPNDRPTAIQLVKMIEQDLKRDPRRGQDVSMMNGAHGMMNQGQRRPAAGSVGGRMVSPQLSPGYGAPQGGYGRGAPMRGRGGRPSGSGGQGSAPGYRGGRRPPGGVPMAGMPRQGTGGGGMPMMANDQGSSYDQRSRQNSAPRGGYGAPRGRGMQRGGSRTPRAPVCASLVILKGS